MHLAGVGGAFGSREDIHMQIHACVLALRTGKPVKFAYGREESFHGHVHRHPSRIWMRHGATRDGRLVAVDARLLFDGGAYASSSPAVVGNAATFAAGPYEVPNVRVEGTVVFTNNPPCGAMRGFGAPQVCFAHEAQMDKLAAGAGRRPGAAAPPQRSVPAARSCPPARSCGAAPRLKRSSSVRMGIPLPDLEPLRAGTRSEYPGGTGNVTHGEGIRRGVGLRCRLQERRVQRRIRRRRHRPGDAEGDAGRPRGRDLHGGGRNGPGLYTFLAQVARTELQVENVVMRPNDTLIGSAGSTSASRQSMMTGGAVQMACASVREEISRSGPGGAGALQEDAELGLADGWVHAGERPLVEIGELLDEPVSCEAVYHHRPTQSFDENGQGDVHVSFAFAAERAVVEVDEELGLVRVLQDRRVHGRRQDPEPPRPYGAN